MIRYTLSFLTAFAVTAACADQAEVKATYEAKTPSELCKKFAELTEKPEGKEQQEKFIQYVKARNDLLLDALINFFGKERQITYNQRTEDILSSDEGKNLVNNLEKLVVSPSDKNEMRKQREVLDEILACCYVKQVGL